MHDVVDKMVKMKRNIKLEFTFPTSIELLVLEEEYGFLKSLEFLNLTYEFMLQNRTRK